MSMGPYNGNKGNRCPLCNSQLDVDYDERIIFCINGNCGFEDNVNFESTAKALEEV